MNTIEGKLVANPDHKFAIIVSRFNSLVTENLANGAHGALLQHGANDQNITKFYVPGSYEMPVVAKRLALSKKFNAIICVGAVIKGGTPHFDYICNETAKGLSSVGLEGQLPVSFGILTCENSSDALERSGLKAGNKGVEAALAALETANLLDEIEKQYG